MGRFAPSPTGPLHVGSLLTAVASWLDARRHGGSWLVRIEDIDPPRELPGASARILTTLERMALLWDGDVLYQSRRRAAHLAALDQLHRDGHVFACTCSRRDLRAAGGSVYTGTCRHRRHPPDDNQPYAWRLAVGNAVIDVADQLQPAVRSELASECGDFIIWRRDNLPAYQLAMVVDDGWQGITHVVRGADLHPNTARQVYLHQLLGNTVPTHAHVPVITAANGHKLSKQTRAPDVYPATDNAARVLLFTCLQLLGLAPPDRLVRASPATQLEWGTSHFDWSHVPRTGALTHWQGSTAAAPTAGGGS